MPPTADPDFAPRRLAELIAHGARTRDAVRTHGAVFAALDLHSRSVAHHHVFVLAQLLLAADPRAMRFATGVIRAHLAA